MEEQDYKHALSVIPHIKKYIKKNRFAGFAQSDNCYQFNYRLKGVRFVNDRYSWNRYLYINLEVSEKYWQYNTKTYTYDWSKEKRSFFSVRRRNQSLRYYAIREAKQLCALFTFPYCVKIGTITVVD